MGSADEYRLLRSARQALASDPTKALNLTQEHIRRFPQGMLTQEREAIAVEALVHLNRHVQAKTRGQAFLAAYPVSPYRSRVEHALSRLAGAAPKP
jgi:hypothetical protein